MVLTGAQCLRHIKHTIGTGPDGSAMSPELDGLMVVNQAGEHMTNARAWKYLEGTNTSVSLRASQAFINTTDGWPSDFRSPIAMEATNGYTSGFRFTSYKHLLELQSRPIQNSESYYWGVVVSVQSATTGAPASRLDIYPTPSGTEDGTGNEFRLFYNSTWKVIDDDSDFLNIPIWAEALYIQFLRAFARGYEEEDEATLSMRLGELQAGRLWDAAVNRDMDAQFDHGVLTNGGMQFANRDPFWNFSSVGEPS